VRDKYSGASTVREIRRLQRIRKALTLVLRDAAQQRDLPGGRGAPSA
jgi:hypothetical protein